ncbi:MAG: DUF6491 family protein [Gammaproteobacteria bacterium]
MVVCSLPGHRAYFRAAAAFALGCLLSACASQPASEATNSSADDYQPRGTQGCFSRRQAQDFVVLDRSTLIVYAPNKNQAYLVQISPPATRMPFADELAFESRSSQICGRTGERVRLAADSMRRYAITDVRRLARPELDKILSNRGRADKGQGLEPVAGDGAEIEPIETVPDE